MTNGKLTRFIEKARKERGMSYEDLALAIGWSVPVLKQRIHGNPTTTNLVAILEAIGCELSVCGAAVKARFGRAR